MSFSSGSDAPLKVSNCLPIDIVLYPRIFKRVYCSVALFRNFSLRAFLWSIIAFNSNSVHIIYIYIYIYLFIYHQLPPTCFGVCYTIIGETSTLLSHKLYAFYNVVT
jgi:hypothetical protein